MYLLCFLFVEFQLETQSLLQRGILPDFYGWWCVHFEGFYKSHDNECIQNGETKAHAKLKVQLMRNGCQIFKIPIQGTCMSDHTKG